VVWASPSNSCSSARVLLVAESAKHFARVPGRSPGPFKLAPVLTPLEGKTAVVTGASSGIGAATAQALAEAGARVAVGARRVDRLPDRDGLFALDLDVTDPASSERFVERALAELGGFDLLVNNAGLALGREPFWEGRDDDDTTMVETNVLGLMRMTRLCLPHIRDGGHIDNNGSIAGRQA
jgi:3-hydroxy acid dehydrogenase/malonic semialdehyde reductase